jgi:Cytochrome c554 and c-prime
VARITVIFLLLLAIAARGADARPQLPRSGSRPDKAISPAPASKWSAAGYVGDDVCGSCHQDKLQTFQQTAHHRTSRLPNAQSIAGRFTPPENTMKTIDPGLAFRMEATHDSFYQTAVSGEPPNTKERSEAFGLVIGSGRKGQTYLYWKGDELFELPVSYWVELGRWVNSPGYLDGTANFDRPVIPRCVECHATFFEPLTPAPLGNRYDQTDFVLGISCERCHGPGQDHVSRHRSASAAAATHDIVNPAELSREKQVEVCAQCHGGLGEEIAPAFSFKPGESLDAYIKLQSPGPDAKVDVHGNQAALLERSRCFQSSGTMTCTTCHDEHAPERTAASYASRCLACHAPEKCAMYTKLGSQVANGCIDCHMPVQKSNLIVSDVNGTDTRANVRNHWIKVYSNSPGH